MNTNSIRHTVSISIGGLVVCTAICYAMADWQLGPLRSHISSTGSGLNRVDVISLPMAQRASD